MIRRNILLGDDISRDIMDLVTQEVQLLSSAFAKASPTFITDFEVVIPLDTKTLKRIEQAKEKDCTKLAISETKKLYAQREKELTSDAMRTIEREVYLQVLDTLWMRHLENMQHLREGIHLRGIAQRDPLVEYRQESQRLFETMQATLREEIVRALFHITLRDVATAKDETYETELTRAAERSVEQGVNELGNPTKEVNFEPALADETDPAKKKKNDLRKKRKKERQNKKKKR